MVQGIKSICNCGQPANPDKTLAQCPNSDCGVWLHEECIKHAILMKTYEALGKDKPYQKPALAIRSSGDKEGVDKFDHTTGRPLSPPDNSAEFQQTIDAKAGDPPEAAVKALANVKEPQRAESEATVGSITATATTAKKGRPAKKKGKADAMPRPYEGLFQVVLRLESPSQALVTDLRGLSTGAKEWTEPLSCLKCNKSLD